MALSLKSMFQNPDNRDRMAGIGTALSALGQGQTADLSGFRNRIDARADEAKMREAISDPAILERFTPEQRQMLANLPPQVAQQIIADSVFAPPAPPPAPTEGKVVGDRLVNPITGEVIFQGEPQGSDLPASVRETIWRAQQLGLEAGTPEYDAFIRENSSGQTIHIGGNENNVISVDEGAGTAVIADPTAPDGLRIVQLPGGTAETDTIKEDTNARMIIDQIDALYADPGLDSAVGMMGAVTSRMGPFAPNSARANSMIEQLQGGVFLEAYQQLKGGGQITEIEGKKAENARARLQTAQSPEDFRAALLEYKEVVETAMRRSPGWINSPEGQAEAQRQSAGGSSPTSTRNLSDAELLELYGGQ